MPFPSTPSARSASVRRRSGHGLSRSRLMIINVTAASVTRTALKGSGGNTVVANFTTTKFTPQISAITNRDASTNQNPGPEDVVDRPGDASLASSLMVRKLGGTLQ